MAKRIKKCCATCAVHHHFCGEYVCQYTWEKIHPNDLYKKKCRRWIEKQIEKNIDQEIERIKLLEEMQEHNIEIGMSLERILRNLEKSYGKR